MNHKHPLNDDTRVSVHCYEGDAPNVRELHDAGLYSHHGCPVTFLSPVDSPVTFEGTEPWIDFRHGGIRESAGQGSLDRQRKHMEILLEYPENFFYMNDGDSICLAPRFPDYLYAEPNVLWSNLVFNPIPEQQRGYSDEFYPEGFPRLAFQPPYFMSRDVIERLLAVADEPAVQCNPVMPFIDHYMVQLAVAAKVTWKAFPDGISYAISTGLGEMERALVEVRHKDVKFVHSVKSRLYWEPLVHERAEYVADFNRRTNGDIVSTSPVKAYPRHRARWSEDSRFVTYSQQAEIPPAPPRNKSPAEDYLS